MIQFLSDDSCKFLHLLRPHTDTEPDIVGMSLSPLQSIWHGIERAENSIIQPTGYNHERYSRLSRSLQPRRANTSTIPSEHFIGDLMSGKIEHTRYKTLGNQLLHGHPAAAIGMKTDHFIPFCL